MQKLFYRITGPISHPETIQLFRGVIYSWVILNTIFLLPAHEHFWSWDSYIEPQSLQGLSWFEMPFYLLNIERLNFLYKPFLVLQILFAILAIKGPLPRLASLAVYFFSMNLDNKAHVILDGGNNLMHLFLFYLIFISPRRDQGISWKNYVTNSFSHLGLFLCRIQLVTVYLSAGLSKAHGELWPKGVALYYTLNISEYTHPALQALINNWPIIVVGGSLGTMAFQLSFPYLVWSRPIRPYVLAAGTLLHLGIAFGMGLMSFGFAMCASYFVFYDNDRARKVLHFLNHASLRNLTRFFRPSKKQVALP